MNCLMALCHNQDTRSGGDSGGGGGSHPFVEMQSAYSTAPADWADYFLLYGRESHKFKYGYTNK